VPRGLVLAFLLAITGCDHSDSSPALPKPGKPAAVGQAKPTFEEAEALLKSGDPVAALTKAREASEAVRRDSGASSPSYAAALFRQAVIQIGANDLASAAESLATASKIPGRDLQSKKDRLTYFMNLGELLLRLGRLEEAERVLRESLQEREALYGTAHAGYAYGLQPLAEVLFAAGKANSALPLIEQSRRILEPEEHQLLPQTLADRGFIIKAAQGTSAPAFEGFEKRRAEVRSEIVRQASGRWTLGDPKATVAALAELRERCLKTPSVDPEGMVVLTSALVNACRNAGDHETRVQGLQWLIRDCETRGQEPEAIHLLQGLAMAYGEAGKPEQAVKSYQEAVERAKKAKHGVSLSNALRNYGLYLSEQQRRSEAAPLLEAALSAGKSCGEPEVHGEAAAAYGIFLQHDKALEKAAPLLREAVELMPPAHPHALMARNHLNALEKSGSCGCGDMDEAISQNLKRMIEKKAPAGLIKELRIRLVPGHGPSVDVDYAREASPEERAQLDIVIKHAVSEMQKQASTPR